MIRRHPHVFGEPGARPDPDSRAHDAAAQSRAWEALKSGERRARRETGTLVGVPVGLPALTRAAKLTSRAARVGFDWPDAAAVLEKLDEEIAELKAELPEGDTARLTDEVGDLLFVLANLARKLNLDPETCLRHANDKFVRRFDAMEQRLARDGRDLKGETLAAMEAAWQAVKREE
jgi:ATP diphosphatase